MILTWAEEAWEDYLYWTKIDKNVVKRINILINDIKRDPHKGLGSPEPLKPHGLGYWTRRINHEHRLVYKPTKDTVAIAMCRHHY